MDDNPIPYLPDYKDMTIDELVAQVLAGIFAEQEINKKRHDLLLAAIEAR
jgi:hypothetical protein